MSKEECLTADWFLIGQLDAEQGSHPSILDARRKDCAKAGVTPKLSDYEAGYEKGLKRYCTARNGYDQGVKGAPYYGICKGFRHDDFIFGYQSGQELFLARDRLSRNRNDIAQYQNNIYRLRSETSHWEAQLVASSTTAEQRYKALEQLKNIQRDIGENEARLRAAERDTGYLERDLLEIERKQPYLKF